VIVSPPVIARIVVLKPHNVRQKTLDEIKPGDVTPEGVVLYVDAHFYATAAGTRVMVDEGATVAVLGKVDKDLLAAIAGARQRVDRGGLR
jgi:hypothetical protein